VPPIKLVVEFIPVKEGILPLPEADNPIEVFVFDQLNEVFVTLLTKFTGDVLVLAHTSWF
jgi:hypothetical protein